MNSLLFPLEIIFLVIAYGLFAYRGFLRLNRVCENAWSNMQLALVKRHDLVTQLIDSQASSNEETIKKLNEVHTRAILSNDMREQIICESDLSQGIAGLAGREGFKHIYEQFKSIERQASQEESYFNALAEDYSRRSSSFPSKLIAQKFGFVAPNLYKSSESFSKELSC